MSRPKSSLIGLADLVVSVHNNRKIRRNRDEQIRTNDNLIHQNHLISNLNLQTSIISNKIDMIGELQLATANGVRDVLSSLTHTVSGLEEIHTELEVLSKGSWEIMNFLQKVERKEEVLGSLRIFLIDVEEEVDKISSFSNDFLIFSFLMSEDLKSLFDSKNVTINHFKRMPNIDDLKWAKKVIRSVDELHISLGKKIAMDGIATATYSKLKKTLIDIPKLERDVKSLSNRLEQTHSALELRKDELAQLIKERNENVLLSSTNENNSELSRLKNKVKPLKQLKSKFSQMNSEYKNLINKLNYKSKDLTSLYETKIDTAKNRKNFPESWNEMVRRGSILNTIEQLEDELSGKIRKIEKQRAEEKKKIAKLSSEVQNMEKIVEKISQIESESEMAKLELDKKISYVESEVKNELRKLEGNSDLILELEEKISSVERRISAEIDFIGSLLPPHDSYDSDLMKDNMELFNFAKKD